MTMSRMTSPLSTFGAGIGSMFSDWENPGKSAMSYLERIPQEIRPFFQPYIEAGSRQLPGLESQYGRLMGNPGQVMNDIGKGYQKSPGFDFALQQALQGAGHSAAAGGMAGSPAAQQESMQLATNLGNQDYNNWMQRALGLYGTGLEGAGQLAGHGLQAGTSLSDQIAQALAQRAATQYQATSAENQHEGEGLGSLISGGLGLLAAFL